MQSKAPIRRTPPTAIPMMAPIPRGPDFLGVVWPLAFAVELGSVEVAPAAAVVLEPLPASFGRGEVGEDVGDEPVKLYFEVVVETAMLAVRQYPL